MCASRLLERVVVYGVAPFRSPENVFPLCLGIRTAWAFADPVGAFSDSLFVCLLVWLFSEGPTNRLFVCWSVAFQCPSSAPSQAFGA